MLSSVRICYSTKTSLFSFFVLYLKSEYNRLMADDSAADDLQSNLLQLAPKLVYREKNI
jgi:hypothetical protein